MKISKVYIKNFRSIKDLEFNFPESGLIVLVGANNAGKSNIVKAIKNILGEEWWGKDIDPMDFYRRSPENTIEIRIEFDNGRRVEFSSSEKMWPKYFDEIGNQIWSSQGNVKEDFPCIYLPAQRDISRMLSFYKWTLMGKISRSFNKLVKEKNLSRRLKEKFKEVMKIFDEIDEFRHFKKDAITFFEELQPDSFYKLKIDFKPFSPLNYFKTINILANDKILGENYDIDIEELGEGSRNLIILSLLRSYAKNFKQEAQGLLIIEEPEIYMHPQARRHLLHIFKEIVRNSNIQIIITTHSSSFLETQHFENIALVYKTLEDGTKIRQVTKEELVQFSNATGAGGRSTIDNITEFYAITSNERLKEAFFTKFLILVEGETEELCFPIFLRKVGMEPDKLGISAIGVGGKTQIPKYWRLFYKFKIPMLIVIDNDVNKPEKERNNQIIADCFNISVKDIENISETFKILNGRFGQKLLVFKENIETALKKDFNKYCENNRKENKYSELENKAGNLGLRKGQKLRYIINAIFNEYADYTPKFLEEIKNILDDVFNHDEK